MRTSDVTLSRTFGVPLVNDGVDGYASGLEAFTATPREVALRPDAVYQLLATEDVYIAMLDLGEGDSSVDESTGRAMLILADSYVVISSGETRNVLSIKAAVAGGTLYITEMTTRRPAL